MYPMEVTLEVMKLLQLRSRLVKLEQPLNMYAIVVTFDVLRLPILDMEVRFDIISVVLDDGDFKVKHIEEAFFPPME